MRILILDSVYEPFLRRHYAERAGLAEEPYDTQWRSLMDRFFGAADAYSHYLGELGHEAHELVVNCEPMQRAWAEEHGFRPRERLRRLARRDWRLDLLAAQVAAFEPDVAYVQDLHLASPSVLGILRRRARVVAGQIASALPGDGRVRLYDLVLTSFPHYVARLRDLGVAAEYLRIAFDPRVLDALDLGDGGERSGAVFVGALNRTHHGGGNAVLEAAARRVPIEFYGFGAEEWPAGSPIRERYRGEAWGLDMYRVLARARIALNRHVEAAEGHANNMRLFEATGVGALLVTESAPNLGDLFEPGREVLTYRDADDLADTVARCLYAPDEAAAIAAAGQRRTLQEHTYASRMRELAEILAARLP